MTLLDHLRRWLFGSDDTSSADRHNNNADDGPEYADEPRLDPDNVTQVRSTRTDSTVSQLRDIKEDKNDGEESDA